MDSLLAYGCPELRPLVEQNILEILNPAADASEAWLTLSLEIVPLREQTRRGLTTYSVEVLRDADVAEERAAAYAPGEGPQSKYTVEAQHENGGWECIEAFEDVDDLVAWIEAGTDRIS